MKIEKLICDFCLGKAHVPDAPMIEFELFVEILEPHPRSKTVQSCYTCAERALKKTHNLDQDIGKLERVARNKSWLQSQRNNI